MYNILSQVAIEISALFSSMCLQRGVDPNLMKNAHAVDMPSSGYHRFCLVMVESDVRDRWI